MNWRQRFQPLIAKTIRDNQKQPPKVLRKALRDAFPCGERSMHPYKIWLSEIAIQLGTKKSKVPRKGEKPQAKSTVGQTELFQ